MAAVKLGVLGGTFDPPHAAHLVLAEQARELLALDRVLWVPAGEPWRKADRAITPAEHRVQMVRLAIAGNEAFELSTLELERDGPSYSVDTLAALRELRPEDELVFVMGEDALHDLPNWREPERIIELAQLGVAAREGLRTSPEQLDGLLPGLAGRVLWITMPRLDISATDLRERAAAGRSLRYLVPDAVARYIAQQAIYRS
ncbi:MAG: nicotinate-nucleotide adenylyltransferase [Dehalococcoidia bacterium]